MFALALLNAQAFACERTVFGEYALKTCFGALPRAHLEARVPIALPGQSDQTHRHDEQPDGQLIELHALPVACQAVKSLIELESRCEHEGQDGDADHRSDIEPRPLGGPSCRLRGQLRLTHDATSELGRFPKSSNYREKLPVHPGIALWCVSSEISLFCCPSSPRRCCRCSPRSSCGIALDNPGTDYWREDTSPTRGGLVNRAYREGNAHKPREAWRRRGRVNDR